ncbi:MAG: hypothetical protein HFJ03_06460 [Lachnospira sp.]|nr:hypothetical protein [Lachnospira sp.]
MKNKKKQENNIIFIMRICTCLLAAVSFWATAQGMINYTFPESWQAYAASLAIQGLLLGLNFALPSFLRQCKNQLQKGVLYCLTFVVLFCSSWFLVIYLLQSRHINNHGKQRVNYWLKLLIVKSCLIQIHI